MPRLFFVVSLSLALTTVVATTADGARSQPAPVHSEQPSAPVPSSSDSIQKQEVKSYTLSPEKYEKAVAYSRTQYRLHFLGVAYSLLLLLIILALRIAPALRDRAERVSRRRFAQAIVFVPLLLLTFDALEFPLDV